MPVICEAVAELLEPDVDDVPPCQARPGHTGTTPCGVPSVVCLHIRCSGGEVSVVFLCSTCFTSVRVGRAICLSCKAVIKQWQEV